MPRFRQQAPLEAWLMGIARNKCRQAHRNRLCRQTIARTFAEDIRQYVHAENPEAPERLAVTQGQFARLVRCLARLRADERILLTLRYLKELPIPEVVELVGKSEAAVRKQLLRALRRLRQCMEDDAAGC